MLIFTIYHLLSMLHHKLSVCLRSRVKVVRQHTRCTSSQHQLSMHHDVTACWHLACKHLLGIISHCPECGWDKLPAEYISLSLFCLDPELVHEIAETLRQSGESPVGTDTVTQQPVSEEIVARDHTAVSALTLSTNVINRQRQLHLSLSELKALTYRASDKMCLRCNMTTLCVVVTDMRQHTECSATFLKPVRHRHGLTVDGGLCSDNCTVQQLSWT